MIKYKMNEFTENDVVILSDTSFLNNEIIAFNYIEKGLGSHLKSLVRNKEQCYLLIRDDGYKQIVRELGTIETFLKSISIGEIDIVWKEEDLFLIKGRKKDLVLPSKMKCYTKYYDYEIEFKEKFSLFKL